MKIIRVLPFLILGSIGVTLPHFFYAHQERNLCFGMSEMDSQIRANKEAIVTIANKMDKDSQHLYDMRQELAITKNEIEHLTETVNELKLSKKHIIT